MADKMDLETAKAVIAEHRKQQDEERRESLRAYVGKFYKYRNSYSLPKTDADYWWLYRAVTGLGDGAFLNGWSFQGTSSGIVTIEPQEYGYEPDSGYTEITADEFWQAAADLNEIISQRLLAKVPA